VKPDTEKMAASKPEAGNAYKASDRCEIKH